MAQPTKTPDWNTALTNNVEPLAGRKSAGFATGGDVPKSPEMNWWMNIVYQWVTYLKNIIAGSETWLGTLNLVQTIGASNGITSQATAVAVVGTGTGANSTGLWGISTGSAAGVFGQSSISGTGPAVKGVSANGLGAGVEGTTTSGSLGATGVKGIGGSNLGNGVWGVSGAGGVGVTGSSDPNGGYGVTGTASSGAGGYSGVKGDANRSDNYGVHAAGSSGGVGLNVTSSATNVNVARVAGYTDLSPGTQPAVTDGFSNQLTKKNVCKAWAYITTNGSGGVTVQEGFNISAASIVAGKIHVAFTTAMSTANYAAVATQDGAGLVATANKLAGSFELSLYDLTTTIYNAAAQALGVHVVVYGAQ